MNTRLLMTLRVTVAPPYGIGAVPHGTRRTVSITGGDFEGPRLRGSVSPGGSADWLLLRADGVLELDLRATLRTDDGALISMRSFGIHMTFTGVRDDANQYFRTLPRFETAAPKYAYLNRLLAVGMGEGLRDGPVHTIEEIL
jgi:hypothetical protein